MNGIKTNSTSVEYVYGLLTTNKTLKRVEVRFTNVEKWGLEKFVESLNLNPSITSIVFDNYSKKMVDVFKRNKHNRRQKRLRLTDLVD